MATKKIELIVGEIPKEPVDESKALKSEPAFPDSETKVEAYHGHGGRHEGWDRGPFPCPPPWPPPGVTMTQCPFCGAVGRTIFGPGSGREVVGCWRCGRAYVACR